MSSSDRPRRLGLITVSEISTHLGTEPYEPNNPRIKGGERVRR